MNIFRHLNTLFLIYSAGCERELVVLQVLPCGSVQKQMDLSHAAVVLTAVASSQAAVLVSGAEDQIIRVRTQREIQAKSQYPKRMRCPHTATSPIYLLV